MLLWVEILVRAAKLKDLVRMTTGRIYALKEG